MNERFIVYCCTPKELYNHVCVCVCVCVGGGGSLLNHHHYGCDCGAVLKSLSSSCVINPKVVTPVKVEFV